MAEPAGSGTKVLVVEDHAALGEALLFAFSFEPDIEVVGLAPTVAAAIEMVAASRPDVVLMDVRLPDGNGIDATPRVLELHPSAAVVVLTAHADPLFALRAAEAGPVRTVGCVWMTQLASPRPSATACSSVSIDGRGDVVPSTWAS